MLKKHGTPFSGLGRYNQILTAVVKALAEALKKMSLDEVKELIKILAANGEIFAGMLYSVLIDFAHTFFFQLSDKEAENLLCKVYFKKFSLEIASEKAKEVVANWRKLATELGYTGPIAWKVREGFTLKAHAPKAGPCYEKFGYLQDWNLKNDEPTMDGLVFFIPRLVAGSKNKKAEEQLALLAETRQRFCLPEHHLSSFGGTAMLSGLILANFKRTGERVPLNKAATRTDTLRSDDGRLRLNFDEGGLRCVGWRWDGEGCSSGVGCFPLGVELGK